MFEIKDKIILITGAASGIGASVVKGLLEEDVKHVTILDINDKNGVAMQEELNEKHGGNKVKFIKCDVTQERELVDAFITVKDEHGYIDVVINNAGLGDDKFFSKTIGVNLTALISGSIQAWNLMRKDKGGRGGTIINIGSIAALSSFYAIPVYSATKSAVVKFSTTLGDDVHYCRTGIRVLTLCFGATDTQIVARENASSFDMDIEMTITDTLDALNLQSPEHAAHGLIDAYKKGKSGSVWIVTSGKPAVDVTDRYVRSCQLFDDIIFD